MRSVHPLALLGILLTTAPLRAADWPQWLGPSRNGATPEIVRPWEAPPEAVWRHPVGNGYSSPIVANGLVIVHAAVEGKDAEVVTAIDARTGKPQWTDSYDRAPYRSQLGVGPRTTPSVSGDRLYTFGITGVLSCYELSSGKRLWQTNPYDTFKVTLPRFGVCSSPLVAEGRVVVMVGGTGSAVVAYDSETGDLAWKGLDEPASSASPIAVTLKFDDKPRLDVVVQTTLRTLGLSTADGSIRWEHPLVFQPAGVSPTPLLIGRTLVCSTQDTGTLAIEFPKDGAAKPGSPWWKEDLTSYFSTGSVGPDGSVLIITNQLVPLPRTDLRCLDMANGEELWKKQGLGHFHIGAITTGDGKLLFLDDSGTLTLAEINRKEFKQLAKSPICRGTLSNPALSDGHIFVRDDKEITCLRLAPAGENAVNAP